MCPKFPWDLIVPAVEVCLIVMTVGTILYTSCILYDGRNNAPTTARHANHQITDLADSTRSARNLPAASRRHIKTVSWEKFMNVDWNHNDKFDTSWAIVVLYVGVPILIGMAVVFVILCAIWLSKAVRRSKVDEENGL